MGVVTVALPMRMWRKRHHPHPTLRATLPARGREGASHSAIYFTFEIKALNVQTLHESDERQARCFRRDALDLARRFKRRAIGALIVWTCRLFAQDKSPALP
ncbi:hypothetical protein C7477_107115 [Phyllobacterium leguminum]|uniref:Uncharacterized protein n=1 Tax=Phyllobacterium leguminum TaxID=314237 RepID=A0A318T3B6_9HYPH|nr:hypothetical protein C7477_107115 [Phyllobacterium leguminum]